MPYVQNFQADAVAAQIDAISLHTADPAGTGANEHPAADGYTRLTPTWPAAAGGTTQEVLLFSGTPSTTITHIGQWSGGVFKGGFLRTSGDPAINAAGELEVTANINEA